MSQREEFEATLRLECNKQEEAQHKVDVQRHNLQALFLPMKSIREPKKIRTLSMMIFDDEFEFDD